MALPFLPEEEIGPKKKLESKMTSKIGTMTSERGQLPLYLLIKLLHGETRLTAIQIRLASEKKLKQIQRRNYLQSLNLQLLGSVWSQPNVSQDLVILWS